MHDSPNIIRSSAVPSIPNNVVKRDGSTALFNAAKILSVIRHAGQAGSKLDGAGALKVLQHKFGADPPQIENIQAAFERLLIWANHLQAARAYVDYNEQRQKLSRTAKRQLMWSIYKLRASERIGLGEAAGLYRGELYSGKGGR